MVQNLREALNKIACYDDTSANRNLAVNDTYSWFDEPGSVQIAREALEGSVG